MIDQSAELITRIQKAWSYVLNKYYSRVKKTKKNYRVCFEQKSAWRPVTNFAAKLHKLK